MQLWFARTELIDVLAWGSLLALVAITLYPSLRGVLFAKTSHGKAAKNQISIRFHDFDEDDGGDERSRRSGSSETAEHDG